MGRRLRWLGRPRKLQPQAEIEYSDLTELLTPWPAPNRGVLEKLARHEREMGTAVVVWHELLFGCLGLPPSRKRNAIERYLREVMQPALPILPYDTAAAEWHARERARLGRSGKPTPFAGGQIAAIAKVNDLVLVTTNVEDHRLFRDLQLEDWRS